jgi:hypothetical protein
MLRRTADIKAKGGYVAPVKVKESLLLPSKVSNEPVTKEPKANPNAMYYDKTGKDVVGASAAPTASGRCVLSLFVPFFSSVRSPIRLAVQSECSWRCFYLLLFFSPFLLCFDLKSWSILR